MASTTTWTTSAGGGFGTNADWSSNLHPVAGDTADITDTFSGANYPVDVTDAEAAALVNIGAANADLQVESAGTLTAGSIDLTAGTLDVLSFGEINGGTITGGSGTSTDFIDGILKGVTWEGTLALTGVAQASLLTIETSLNVLDAAGTGPGEIDITGPGAELDFDNSMTLNGTGGNLAIDMGSTTGSSDYLGLDSGFILTLGSTVSLNQIAADSTIHLADAAGQSGGTIVNNGTITLSSGSGSGAFFNGSNFINNGHINVVGGGSSSVAGEDLELTPSNTFEVGSTGAISVNGYGLVHINGPNGSVDVSGTISVSGHGTVDLDTASVSVSDTSGTGAVLISNGGTLEINYDYDGTVIFLDSTGVVALGQQGGAYTGTIAGMSRLNAGTVDVIDLLLTTSVTTLQPNFTSASGGVLNVMDNATTLAAINLEGNYVGQAFTFATDGIGGTDIFLACFAAGTHILTEQGEVAVEALRQDDRVLAHMGDQQIAPQPVVWIGRREIDCRRHPRPSEVWPVRIRAGAFGLDTPSRDLFLSPDHAVYVSGVLVPIRHLVNGTSIARVPVDEITYYHVELPRHGVLLAEELPVESHLDSGDRANFISGGQVIRLFPRFSPPSATTWETHGCARLVVTGPELDAIRRELNGSNHHDHRRHVADVLGRS